MSTKINYSGSGTLIESTEKLVQFEVVETPISIAPTISPQAPVDDLEYSLVIDSDLKNNAVVYPADELEGSEIVLESKDITVASIEDSNKIIHEEGGSTQIFVYRQGFGGAVFVRNLETPNTEYKSATGFVSGALGEHVMQNMQNLISGLSPTRDRINSYSYYNADWASRTFNVVRNPFLFCAAYDWTGISVSRTDKNSDGFPIILIDARHFIVSTHVRFGVGNEYVFTDADGNAEIVTVDALVTVENSNDTSVGYLDRELSSDFKRYKLPPTDWIPKYLPTAVDAFSPYLFNILPTIRRSKHYPNGDVGHCFAINTVSYLLSDLGRIGCTRFFTESLGEISYGWGDVGIPGDSGGPSFILVDNGTEIEPVLISVLHTIITGDDFGSFISEINDAMDTVAGAAPGTYSVAQADFSAFTDFS